MICFFYFVSALKFNKNRLPIVMTLWSILVIGFSIVDVILMSLLIRDYGNCSDSTTDVNDIYCFLVTGIGFALAVRGFLVWTLNVISAGFILSYGIKVILLCSLLSLNRHVIRNIKMVIWVIFFWQMHRENYVSKTMWVCFLIIISIFILFLIM